MLQNEKETIVLSLTITFDCTEMQQWTQNGMIPMVMLGPVSPMFIYYSLHLCSEFSLCQVLCNIRLKKRTKALLPNKGGEYAK